MLDKFIMKHIHKELSKRSLESLKDLYDLLKSLNDNHYISKDDYHYYLHYISTTKAA